MRGVTFQFFGVTAHLLNISTRTPHAGSDASGEGAWSYAPLFQPALPMRGVTKTVDGTDEQYQFQPALPMRGVTPTRSTWRTAATNFNPHSPCGE